METVTNTLRKDILTGRFEPGDRLLEIQLSDEYDCGRDAIRSAFVALTTEGLVQREENRGATVRRISLTEAIQITEARTVLESLIAAQAARVATPEDHQQLLEIIEQMRTAVANNQGAAYSKLNHQFHARLREMSGHDVAAQLVENLRNRAAHHQYRLAVMPGRSADSLEQHAAIADAVVAGDEQAASQSMTAHLHSVIEVLQRWGDMGDLVR